MAKTITSIILNLSSVIDAMEAALKSSKKDPKSLEESIKRFEQLTTITSKVSSMINDYNTSAKTANEIKTNKNGGFAGASKNIKEAVDQTYDFVKIITKAIDTKGKYQEIQNAFAAVTGLSHFMKSMLELIKNFSETMESLQDLDTEMYSIGKEAGKGIVEVGEYTILKKDKLKEYLNTFEFSPQFKMKIFVEEHKIYAQRLGEQDAILLYPFEEDKFYAKSKDATLEFSKVNSTEFNQLTLSQGGKTMVGKKIEIRKGWGIIGSALPNGWDGLDVKLIPDSTIKGKWTITNVTFGDGEIKFRLDNDWTSNYGAYNSSDNLLIQDGDNIKITSGNYDITLDLTIPSKPRFDIKKSKL